MPRGDHGGIESTFNGYIAESDNALARIPSYRRFRQRPLKAADVIGLCGIGGIGLEGRIYAAEHYIWPRRDAVGRLPLRKHDARDDDGRAFRLSPAPTARPHRRPLWPWGSSAGSRVATETTTEPTPLGSQLGGDSTELLLSRNGVIGPSMTPQRRQAWGFCFGKRGARTAAGSRRSAMFDVGYFPPNTPPEHAYHKFEFKFLKLEI